MTPVRVGATDVERWEQMGGVIEGAIDARTPLCTKMNRRKKENELKT
jgi:hypothetical protein